MWTNRTPDESAALTPKRRRRRLAGLAGALASLLFAPAAARAEPLLPGPGQPGHDADLAAKLGRVERQIHGIMTVSLGWGLEAFVEDPASRDLIEDFVASDAATFEESSGQHIYAVLDNYGEFGDLGMFGGVQAAGDAFRYAVLRDEGADPAKIEVARDQLIAAMDGLHWYHQITGTPGVVARGLRRAVPQSGAPPLPGTLPPTVPLFDDAGQPQPAEKEPTWREDQSGELPDLIWLDDTSKDQVIGYIFALGVVYDTVANDETIPAELVDRLVQDAAALAQSLMEPREIGIYTVDLVLVDADGRRTSFFDMAAEVLTPSIIRTVAVNPFNAVMALGGMRTLYQITGDDAVGDFYYDELIDQRGYLDLAAESLQLLWFGDGTNHSNVNMAFVALYALLRYEPDPEIAGVARQILETQLYGPDPDRSARGLQQSLFDFMVAGFGTTGTSGIGQTAMQDGLTTLSGHPDAPLWNTRVENCDPAEIEAGECTAIDGSTITVAQSLGWNEAVVAVDPLPIEIRPPSNFQWRSNPHDVNDGGGTRLNPGGGIYCAYWLGRRLLASDDGLANVSVDARGRPGEEPDPDPDPGGSTGGGTGAPEDSGGGDSAPGTDGSTGEAPAGSTDDDTTDDGCACRSQTPARTPWPWFLLVFACGIPRPRR